MIQIYAIIALGIAFAGFGGFMYYKGKTACEARYLDAQRQVQHEGQKAIRKVEKDNEKIRHKLTVIEGPNDLVGPRVSLAIDSVPDPRGGE